MGNLLVKEDQVLVICGTRWHYIQQSQRLWLGTLVLKTLKSVHK